MSFRRLGKYNGSRSGRKTGSMRAYSSWSGEYSTVRLSRKFGRGSRRWHKKTFFGMPSSTYIDSHRYNGW